MTKKKAAHPKEEEIVDVTKEETHFMVQCEDIRLISSNLKPLVSGDDKKLTSSFGFKINAVVEGQKAYSYLQVQVNCAGSGEPDEKPGFQLTFVLMGIFQANQGMVPSDLGNFVKMYTLTILWPYAREYASDQFKRTGCNEALLPIINPQVVTEQIVENNLVEVDIVQSETQQ